MYYISVATGKRRCPVLARLGKAERLADFRFSGYSGLVVLAASLSESDPKKTFEVENRADVSFVNASCRAAICTLV